MPKYNSQTIEAIANAIEASGEIQSGIEAGGISSATFHRWRKDHPDFDEKIKQALETFRINSPTALRQTAMARLKAALEDGQVIKRTRTTTKTIQRHDAAGNLLYTETHTETRESVDELPVPQWAIERILGKPIQDIEDAIKLIEAYGLKTVVADVELFRKWLIAHTDDGDKDSTGQASKRGLSEETANIIRAQILGVSPDHEPIES